MDIRARTRRALEWDSLIEFLADESCTAWGRELCLSLEPCGERAIIELLLDETAEGLSLLQARSALALEEIPDLREALQRLSAGATLSASELNDLKTVLDRTRKTRGSLSLLEKTTFPRLTEFLPKMHGLDPLTQAIAQAIDPGGQVKDEASSQLASLRRDIRKLDNQIKDALSKIIHSSTLSKALQEPLYTQRNNRYVLPVNASQRHVIEGIVHDSSASGLTVYVEPTAVVEMSNKIRLKEAEIEREITRILTELSSQARSHFVEIDSSFRVLVELDFIMARARLASLYGGQRPELARDGRLHLRSARHPLLILQNRAATTADTWHRPFSEVRSTIIANDIILGGEERTMVVTGPNTGGKTVLLKTTGLLSLMARAGLLLPVAPGSVAVIFNDIQADIGDEQSLAQNLSTFSSHMTNIVEIINQAADGSLILLDEIGAGTDPREGAALARAILEQLNQSGALTISTTHYGQLKTLAYAQSGFINASLDFDEATLSPTYRLRLGVPGSSKATTIARRLGLNPEVVERADSYAQSDETDIQKITEELEARLNELAAQEEKARAARLSAENLEARAHKELTDLDAEREHLRRTLAAEIENEFEQARQQLRALISSLQKQPSMKVAQQTQKDMEQIRRDLKWLSPAEAHSLPASVSVGMKVRVKSLNQVGVVEEILSVSAKQPVQNALVRAGNMKMKVPVNDLEIIGAGGQKSGPEKRSAAVGGQSRKRSGMVAAESTGGAPAVFVRTGSNTLDLRGQRVEAALADLERFLDEAYLQDTGLVMIIHGHGTGAVKSAVREYLSGSTYARSFRAGEVYEGGDGVTVVDLG